VETKTEILQELQAISSVLAAIPKKNCFKMPENYLLNEFEQNHQTEMAVDKLNAFKKNSFKLPHNLDTDQIIDGVKAQLILSNFPNLKESFKVPTNYFEGLAERLSFITKEEENVALGIPKANYSVPTGYFENLTHSILSKVAEPQEEKLNPLFEQMRHEQIFKVPETYFESLTNAIVENAETEISVERIEEVASKSNNFKVPVAYFDGLYSRLNRKIKQTSTKTSTSNWRQLVSVLSLCAIFVLGIWFTNGLNNNSFEDQIAALKSEFNEFLLTEFDEADYNFDLLQNAEITDEDIEHFLIDVDETFINSL